MFGARFALFSFGCDGCCCCKVMSFCSTSLLPQVVTTTPNARPQAAHCKGLLWRGIKCRALSSERHRALKVFKAILSPRPRRSQPDCRKEGSDSALTGVKADNCLRPRRGDHDANALRDRIKGGLLDGPTYPLGSCPAFGSGRIPPCGSGWLRFKLRTGNSLSVLDLWPYPAHSRS